MKIKCYCEFCSTKEGYEIAESGDICRMKFRVRVIGGWVHYTKARKRAFDQETEYEFGHVFVPDKCRNPLHYKLWVVLRFEVLRYWEKVKLFAVLMGLIPPPAKDKEESK